MDPDDPNRPIVSACTVLNKDGDSIATIPTTVPNPLEKAAVVIANYEAHYGYPGFKGGAEGCPTRTGSSGSSEEFWPTPFLSLRVHASNTAMAV